MVRVVQIGLGPIGRAIAARVRRRAGFELCGAADPRSDLVGRDLGELLDGEPLGLRVAASAEQACRWARPDLVLHATGSRLGEVVDQFRPLLRAGVSVVSTCEELAYPYHRYPDLSRELDAEAREAGSVLLGTGVNPGFVMDKLVVTLMSACDRVQSVRVSRLVDAARRRGPFQKKIGAGLAPSAFEVGVREGRLGHVGLAESAHMLADAMGVDPERSLREECRAILAERRADTGHVSVEVGQVAGLEQSAALESKGTERVHLKLRMYVGAGQPQDSVSIEGSPPLEMIIGSGVPGDEGTAALVVSCLRAVRDLRPGLRTMLDVPLRPGGAGS